MGRLKQKIIAAAAALFVAASGPTAAHAAVKSPESVRIGLFYKSTAVSSFDINADKGLQIGYVKDGKFSSLYAEAGGSAVTIRKDTFFTVNGNNYVEYNPGAQGNGQGAKLGPVHIRLGESYNDYISALNQAELVKQKGIDAYPAFADSWQVWSGLYLSEAEAQSDIAKNLEKKLGSGSYTVIPASDSRVSVYKSNSEIAFMFDSAGGFMQVHPKQENNPYAFKVNGGSRYRGILEVRRLKGSDMTVINILPFEEYIYGVVPSEIESNSKPEALKAQAVASRTYAFNNMGKHKDTAFDLCTTTDCHVYKGMSGEAPSTTKAVDDTKGKLVLYNGKPAEVYYFASSGGWTESSKNVWSADLPYLKGVEDKYELTTSSHYYWEKTFTPTQIKDIVLKKGVDVGEVVGVNVKKKSESGRVMELEIKGSKNSYTMKKEESRTSFGLNSLLYELILDAGISIKSNTGLISNSQIAGMSVATAGGVKKVETAVGLSVSDSKGIKSISAKPASYKFKGKGWGHGVGMSQEGAKGMANAGFTYEQILKYYYQGTTVE